MQTMKNTLQPQLKIDGLRFWLDSKTALTWIQNKGEWKQFTPHRVEQDFEVDRHERLGIPLNSRKPCRPQSQRSVCLAAERRRTMVAWSVMAQKATRRVASDDGKLPNTQEFGRRREVHIGIFD